MDEKKYWRVNCAGQGCPDRDGCRRYRLRLPEVVAGPRPQVPIFAWASWDIERDRVGECESKVKFREA